MRASGRALALVALVAAAGGCIYDVSRFRNEAGAGDGAASDGAVTDGATEAGPDASPDGEAGLDAPLDAPGEANVPTDVPGEESSFDAPVEASPDAEPDAGAGIDVLDAGSDAAPDADVPAPVDALEAGSDAPPDVAPPDDVACVPMFVPEAGADASAEASTVDAAGADASDAAPDAPPASCTPGATEACYPAGATVAGVCRRGLRWCTPDGVWADECVGAVTPGATEICGNDDDDDCNGVVNDGCMTACPMRPTSCSNSGAAQRGVGTCASGTITCGVPIEACDAPVAGAQDVCGDGRDDDCDGVVDDHCDGFAPVSYRLVENPPGVTPEPSPCVSTLNAVLTGPDDGDDKVALLPAPTATQRIPFELRYFGRLMPGVLLVSTNGWMSFGEDGTRSLSDASAYEGSFGTEQPNNVIAPCWTDLTLSRGGVCFALRGAAPQRRFVVEWSDTQAYEATGRGTLQAIVHEAPAGQSNTIDLAYVATGRSFPRGVVGLENATGSEAITYSRPLTNNLVLRFVPQPACPR